MNMIAGYRENLREAQRELDIAQQAKDEYRRQELIVWGTSPRNFTGWLVCGKKADDVYSAWHKARTDVEHWGNLITEEAKRPTLSVLAGGVPPMTAEEWDARKRAYAERMAAQLGEKPSNEEASP